MFRNKSENCKKVMFSVHVMHKHTQTHWDLLAFWDDKLKKIDEAKKVKNYVSLI